MDWSSAIPALVVTLREGVEATLAVGIVLAYLNRVGQQKLYGWVFGGVAAGIVGSVVVGVLLQSVVSWTTTAHLASAPVIEPLLEGIIGIVAILLLSWMLVWMARQANQLKGDTERAVAGLLDRDRGATLGLASLAGIAVLREGFELALFLLAQVQRGWMSIAGCGIGLAGALVIGLLLFRWGIRIDLGRFFKLMGIVLLAIVAGLVVSTLADLDEATVALDRFWASGTLCQGLASSHDVCWLGPQVWDLSATLPQRQFPGMVLRSLFGYTDRLYAIQAIAYGAFWAIVGGLYARSLPAETQRPVESVPSSDPSDIADRQPL